MRLDVIGSVFRKELREMLRDRRSLAVMFGLPLVLYPLIAIGMFQLGETKKQDLTSRTERVILQNANAAPHLRDMMERHESGIELVPPARFPDPRKALEDGRLDAVVQVPNDCERRALAGDEVELKFRLDRSRTSASFVEKKLQKIADEYQHWVIEQRLTDRGIPASVLAPVKREIQDVANGSQRFGHLMAQILPVLLMMTGMLGALFPALNATTTERELGTLETLLVTPARRTDLLIAKGALVLVCGLLTAALNMLSMSLVLLRSYTLATEGAQKLSIAPGMLALSYVAAMPTLIFFTAIVLIVGLAARNFREANAFATPVMLIPLAAFAIAFMEPAATPALLITPVANTTIIIREVLTGRVHAAQFLLAFASSCMYAGLILSVAARLFSSEQLVNPSWEPLSLKGFRLGTGARRRHVPAIDEALVLFCAVLLLLFYVQPSILEHVRSESWKLLTVVAGNELLLILAPIMLLASLARWDWVQTFNLRQPRAVILVSAAMIGIGLSPWAQLASEAQNHFWPRDAGSGKLEMELLVASLKAHAVLTVVVVGLLAGVCEELLFRGPIQTALLRGTRPAYAILLAAILFSAIHMDVHGFAIRAILGAILGWIVWRSGSIFPAMLAHGLFDSTQLALSAWQVHHGAAEAQTGSLALTASDLILLAAAGVLVAAATMLWRRQSRTAPDISPATPASAHF